LKEQLFELTKQIDSLFRGQSILEMEASCPNSLYFLFKKL